MYIAFASSTGIKIDQHFGYSKVFYLYKVGKDSSKLLTIIDSSEEPEGEKEKLNYKIGTISEANIMYCTQIGPTASKMIQAAGVHPVRVAEDETIQDAIVKLQDMLSNSPAPWLLRIYHKAEARSA
ncbi:MAG: nitrogen fixation protein NifX [Sulfurimonas sp.]|jgi:nitrogen fixation protein NifX|uniref:NifB/NifX family molybdenum-iron cluster-binding protein n=1 Tax=Sulfurimonas sp. TaxID=2022749 RepID=UPI0039E240A4